MNEFLDKKAARAEAKKQLAIVARQEKAARYDALTAERPAGERWITMSNALTRAAHGLTLGEKRIIMAAVSKLDSLTRPANSQAVPTTKITAAEYAEIAECEPNAAYEALQTAAKNLYNRTIVMFEPSFKRGDRKIGDKGTVTHMRWVGQAKYHDKEAWIELAWWHELVPHLMGLKKNFTSYQLQQTSALRSVYSWRLLELLMRFKSTGKAEYTIEDFCTSMQATDKQRANFNNIKRRMLDPAVKELTEKDNWLIQWEPVKAGRKVKALRFNFIRNPQQQLPLD
jgi:plasmid replication initiation protein